MSFNKAIQSGKEHRKPYRGAKAIDPACRNHGSDSYMVKNRLHNRTKAEQKANAQMKDIEDKNCEPEENNGL